jgi:hypothetical protein
MVADIFAASGEGRKTLREVKWGAAAKDHEARLDKKCGGCRRLRKASEA